MAETMQTEDDQTGPVNEIRALPAVDKETNAAPHDVRGRVQGQSIPERARRSPPPPPIPASTSATFIAAGGGCRHIASVQG